MENRTATLRGVSNLKGLDLQLFAENGNDNPPANPPQDEPKDELKDTETKTYKVKLIEG